MDILAKHITQDDAAPGSGYSKQEILALCDEIERDAKTPETARARLPDVCALIRHAPDLFRPQYVAALLLERARARDGMLETWTALSERFPEENAALRYRLRWLRRAGRSAEAAAIMEADLSVSDVSSDTRAQQAELCAEIGDPEHSDRLFEVLLEEEPDNLRVRVIFGKLLFARGDVMRAFEVLSHVRDDRLSPTARRLVDQNDRAIQTMEAIAPSSAGRLPDTSVVLRNALYLFRDRQPRPLDANRLGGISFFTGSLGAGGAERQMTRIATAMHQRASIGRSIQGTQLDGPVEVLINHADPAQRKDFFLPALKASGIPVSICTDMPSEDFQPICETTECLTDIVPLLPRHTRAGLEKLCVHLRNQRPDVFYVWQDGAVLTGVLAALAAEVPRIVLSLRGLPPNLRPHLMKPEYFEMYQALATIPGVGFSCNSRRAADAYADWLDLPKDTFSVIYNAVPRLDDTPSDADRALWERFAAATPDATHTIGGVFRFNANKRPLLWIEAAQKALACQPGLRFVLIGDGEDMNAAKARATELGLADRILFVGQSLHVGFWMTRFSALLHLAETEGLPNVLIEAQMAGVPVIATPAGGSAETFTDGETGFLLSSAQTPALNQVIQALGALFGPGGRHADMSVKAREFAGRSFNLETILAQTVRYFHGQTLNGDKEDAARENVAPFPALGAQVVFDPKVRDAYNVFAEK